jgi:hypothetical protein
VSNEGENGIDQNMLTNLLLYTQFTSEKAAVYIEIEPRRERADGTTFDVGTWNNVSRDRSHLIFRPSFVAKV